MNPLVASIINNPSAHQVNRAEKMSKTIDVMVDNLIKQESQFNGAQTQNAKLSQLGYGLKHGRNTGD